MKINTNLKLEHILDMFSKEIIYESEDEKVIFPIKDLNNNVVRAYEVNLYKKENKFNIIEENVLCEETKKLVYYVIGSIKEVEIIEEIDESEM